MTTPVQVAPHPSHLPDPVAQTSSAPTVGAAAPATPVVGAAPRGKEPEPRAPAAVESSRRLRARSQELRRAARRARARAEIEGRRTAYAWVLGTCNGSAVHFVIRRDGTVVGGSALGDADPLRATLTAARACDRIAAISISRAGWRPGIPRIEAAASLDGWADVPWDLQQRITERLRRRVIRPLFAVELRASALRGRTTDPFIRQELDEIVATLDEAVANLRHSVADPPLLARHDGPSPMSDRDREAHSRVVADLHAVGMAAQRLHRRSDDPSVQEQLRRIVDRLGDAISDLRSILFERSGRGRRPGAADGRLAAHSPSAHPEVQRQPRDTPADPDDVTLDA